MAFSIRTGVLERPPSPMLRAASVRISRQLGAAPERIFDAWLDAGAALAFLFAGRPEEAVSAESDARVGGEFRIVRRSDGQGVAYSGEYLEIDRPHRLVFSLFAEKYALRDDRVIVELAPVAGHSLLVLTHEMSLPNPAERSRIRRGWARVLDRLGALLLSARHRIPDHWDAGSERRPSITTTRCASGYRPPSGWPGTR